MALLTLLGLLALIAVPGVGAVLALLPAGRVSLVTRLALVFGLGYAVAGGTAYVLTIARVLSPATYFPVLIVATLFLWAMAVRRGIPAQWTAMREEFTADRTAIIAGLLIIGAIAFIWMGYLPTFRAISPYRYWVDGMEIADAGRVPALTLHYGRLFPPVTSKIFLNSFSAAADYVSGGRVLHAVNAMLWITAVGTGVALWAVARELGARLTAPLLPLLLLANRILLGHDMSFDLSSYRAEIVGRMIAFSGLALAITALRDRPALRESVLAGAVLGVAAGTHLVPTLASGAFLGSYLVGLTIVEKRVVPLARSAAAIAGVTAVVAGAVLLLPAGEVGFEGAGRPQNYARVSFDKTEFLYNGSMSATAAREGPYLTPGTVVHSYVGRALGVGQGSPLRSVPGILLVGLLALITAGVVLFRGPRDVRAAAPAAAGLASALVAGAVFFAWRYDLYIPATFGVRRLFDYAALPVAVMAVIVTEIALRATRRFRPDAPGIAAAVLIFLSAVTLMPSARVGKDGEGEADRTAAVVDWVRTETPCGARLLVNQRTVGLLRAMTGRVGVLEGMGPFLRPRMLDEIVDLLLRARSFFRDPRANARFLRSEGVDYVIAMKGFRIGHIPEVGNADPELLRDVPFLRPVHSSETFDAYRVEMAPSSLRFPDSSGQPGYRCAREPVAR